MLVAMIFRGFFGVEGEEKDIHFGREVSVFGEYKSVFMPCTWPTGLKR
jgi:hypothetical protein